MKNLFLIILISFLYSCSEATEIQRLKKENQQLKVELEKIKNEQKLNGIFAFSFSNKDEIKLGEEIEIYVGAGLSNREKKQRIHIKDDRDKIIKTEIAENVFNKVIIKGTKKGVNTFKANLEFYIGTKKRIEPVIYEFTVK